MSLRCLIVDDSEPFRGASRALLSGEGIEVTGTAATAPEGLCMAWELNPDVILVDVDLGADSGFALAGLLTAARAEWQVILISTHSVEDYAELVAATEAAGFITKSELRRSAIEALLRDGQAAGERHA